MRGPSACSGRVKEGGTAGPFHLVPPRHDARTPDASVEVPLAMTHRFTPLPAQVNLPKREHEVLQRGRDGKVFERSLEQNASGPQWTFYEGPPAANGMPGVHHVEARVFKDVFPRYRSMRG